MINNQNLSKASFNSGNELKNMPSLILKLKSSLKFQKEFIKEIEQNLQVFIENEVQNTISSNSSINELIDSIPFIIKELGISFAHNFLQNSSIYYSLIGLYFDKKEKNDEKYSKKITLIFDACIDIFKFSFSNDELNEIKEYLYEMKIIENKNEIINAEPKEEEKLYENIYILLNGLKTLIEIGKDKEKIDELNKKYLNIKKDIKILSNKTPGQINQAEIEFFNELIQEIDDYFKKINLQNTNIIINEIPENKKIEEIINIPLEQRTFFYLNEKIKETKNELIEFKNYSLPLTNKEDGEDIKRQICGFLNSRGGRLYIGINGQNIVKGVVF